VMAEPVLAPSGEPTALRSVYQDVTKWRRTEQALVASHKQLARQQRQIEDDRHLAVEFQRSVLPLPSGYIEKPGMRAAVRYLPAGSGSRVGGDWYETTAIESGGVFLAIGDASGHGLMAAAAMARLRNALSGLAFTGAAPDELLAWLNLVVLHWPGSLTATVVAARYDPESKTMTWAHAGHLPPVLIRDGEPAFLDVPEGVVLGATEESVYTTQTLQLRTGDMLLLYTDGLIERRGRDITDGLDLLLRAAQGCDVSDPGQSVRHLQAALGAPNPNDDTCLLAVRFA
jgi:serine phosphatase RsbU (regulator of sigma subunit)